MKTKAFIFDFDGTIGETIPLVLEATYNAFRTLGLRVPTRDEVVAHFGPSELGLFRQLDNVRGDELYQLYLRFYDKFHDDFSPAPFRGIGEIVKKLKADGTRIAIVTGKSRATADISLRHYGLEGVFSPIQCGGLDGGIKPQRIAEVLAEWGEKPSQNIFYVGDAVQDSYDAQASGIVPLSAAWSKLADPDALKKTPTRAVFSEVEDFARWLESAD